MLILFGTKSYGKVIQNGSFNCFRCSTERNYDLISYKKYFALFFIPLIPLGNGGDTLVCNSCKTQYDPRSVLSVEEYNNNKLITANFKQIASTGKRFGGYLIDMIFLMALNLPLATYLAPHLPDYFNNRFHLVFLPVWFIYFFLMEVFFKATIGKKIMGIKTVSDNKEEPLSIGRYFLRSIVKCIPLINIILLFNNKHKGLHDYAANTVVVEK